ncbi:MAG: IS5/IS1182 family transposase, partial [Endozoicomonadaceae bacterium]|nr:IS5/IS1182 family transposase [Endozoicomonadaceae bacterium]
ARAQERFEHEQAEYQQKTDKREAQKKAGQKPRGSEPKPPQPRPKAKDQVNLTDEESRIMPVSGGGFEQCYNAQASVDTDTMLVVSEHMSQAPNDKKEIEPALKKLWSLPQELGAAEDFLANTGYVTKYSIGERSYTLKDIHHRRCFIETIFIPSI